jgi:TonB family protein
MRIAMTMACFTFAAAAAAQERDGPEPRREPRGVELFPRDELSRAAGWELPPEPEPDAREEQAEANLDGLLDDEIHTDRLRAGNADAWYFELAREMRRTFRPDQQAVERGRRAGMAPWARVYDELRRHAAPPEPPMDLPGQPGPENRIGVRDPTNRGDPVLQWRERMDRCNALNSPVTWYRVDLRITHDRDGRLSAVWVIRSSGIRALDEAALRAVRQGSVSLPALPPRIAGSRSSVRSDWAFEMGDVATPIICWGGDETGLQPPTMELMCVDDPDHGTMCAIGGRGIIRTRLRLLRIVDAQHPSREDRRTARRRDPDRPRP